MYKVLQYNNLPHIHKINKLKKYRLFVLLSFISGANIL
jgi:hypothetical protein